MLKRKYVKRAYIEEAICDKCGSPMQHTGVVLTSYPAWYPYVCTNKECDYKTSYLDYERPGILRYEFEDEDLPPVCERIIDTFCEVPLSQVYPSTVIANLIAQGEGFADKTRGTSYV